MMSAMDAMTKTMRGSYDVGAKATFGNRVKAFVDRLNFVLSIRRSRISLCELTDVQLKDVGISRHEAEKEARKLRLF